MLNRTTRGPSAPRMRSSGPKLPCTSPAWWMAASPVAAPMASAVSAGPSSGPSAPITSVSDGPSMNSLTR